MGGDGGEGHDERENMKIGSGGWAMSFRKGALTTWEKSPPRSSEPHVTRFAYSSYGCELYLTFTTPLR
nr:hypothetical protein Iba_chr01aCG19500 [Ipomoea batatas]GMC50634.1 hypothetical protein Iba_chr01bCG18730 [Ipomoea batatas]